MRSRSATPGLILRRLKDTTAALHDEVERRVDLGRRLRDRSTYAELLGRFHGFYAPAEAALGRRSDYATLGLDFGARRKAAWLAADLAALGRGTSEFPTRDESLDCPSLGAALGRMYVFEGATLGGRVVTRLAAERLSLTPEFGCAFFAGYGDRTAAMWDEFRRAVVRYAVDSAREDEVLAAAARTFRDLCEWLAPAGGRP
jgi:heme oxygenase